MKNLCKKNKIPTANFMVCKNSSQVNKFLTAEKTAEEIMGPRRQHPIDAPDQKRAKYMQEN